MGGRGCALTLLLLDTGWKRMDWWSASWTPPTDGTCAPR
jgi:hypothetical protein